MRNLGIGWQQAVAIAAGMILLFVGVVAGSATGALFRADGADPLLMGQVNTSRQSSTELSTSTTSGAALEISQNGTGTGLRASSVRGIGGIFSADRAGRYALLAQNTADGLGSGAAIRAEGGANTGVQAGSAHGTGLYAQGESSAIVADGATALLGDLTVKGACDSCGLTLIAVNVSQAVIRPGTALALAGVTTDDAGDLIITVTAAENGDRVIGIALAAVVSETLRPAANEKALIYVTADARDTVPDGTLRIQLSGVVAAARATITGGQTQPGDLLMAGETPGVLVKATPADAAATYAYALGPIDGGTVAILIIP